METNEHLNKIDLKHWRSKNGHNEEDMSKWRMYVEQSCGTNVCGNDVVSNWPIMHVLNQGKNVKSIDANKLKECEWLLKNIVIHGIKEQSTERYISFWNVIE